MGYDDDVEDIYIIPHNYTDNGKIFGIFDIPSVYLALLWFVPMTYLDFRFFPIALDFKLMIFILFIVPPTIIALVGIGHETLYDFLIHVYRFYKRSKYYPYEK